MKCKDCGIDYPEGIVNQMFASGVGYVPVCGICALQRVNEIHGTKLKSFRGEMAEEARQRAIEYRGKLRRKHDSRRTKETL